MRRTLLALALLVALAASAPAQITIYTVTAQGQESPADTFIDVGTAPSGDLIDTRFRLRNAGTISLNLTTLRVQGVGFSLIGNPTLPYVMAPGTNVDFRVRFLPVTAGSFSATLQANDKSVLLRGIAIPAPKLYFDRDGTLEPVTTSQTIDFGRVQRGQTLTRRLLLRNEGATAFTTRSILISGSGLVLTSLPGLPVTLAPGEAAPFEISATPARSGILQGTLEVDGRQFAIAVTALDPPLPDFKLNLPTQLDSGQQGKLSVQLVSASPLTTTMTATLTFTPLGTSPDDAAILFTGSSSRTVTLNVTEGDTFAKLSGQQDVTFQTGTTAGTLTFKVQAGLKAQEQSITIAPSLIRLDTVKTARTSTAVEVTCTGFDNARSASQAAFTFYDKTGRAINADPIRAAVTDVFGQYFKSSQAGGLFSLKASFPVAGDSTQIGSVEVQFVNSVGASVASRGTF